MGCVQLYRLEMFIPPRHFRLSFSVELREQDNPTIAHPPRVRSHQLTLFPPQHLRPSSSLYRHSNTLHQPPLLSHYPHHSSIHGTNAPKPYLCVYRLHKHLARIDER
jgi:hypothetical protein